MEAVIKAAKVQGVALELNAQPDRLDLTDVYCKMAKEMGAQMCISTDAHSLNELNFLRFGVYQARRGWLEAKDVLNTRSAEELLQLFEEGRTVDI